MFQRLIRRWDSWVRYSVAAYVGLLFAGTLTANPPLDDPQRAERTAAHWDAVQRDSSHSPRG